MDMRFFEPASMVAITAPMVDPAEDRPLLESIPLISPLVPQITAAHETLVNMQMTQSDLSAALKSLMERALVLDVTHDSLYRGVYNILSGIADMQTVETKRVFVLGIRDTLCPKGLSGVLDAYLVEAGNTALLKARLTDEIRDYLNAVVIEQVPLFEAVTLLIATGEALGKVERERARLSTSEDNEAVTKADLLAARRTWIRNIQVMIQLLDIAPNVSDEVRNRLLQPLLKEEARMAKKRASDSFSSAVESAIDALAAENAVDATEGDTDAATGTES